MDNKLNACEMRKYLNKSLILIWLMGISAFAHAQHGWQLSAGEAGARLSNTALDGSRGTGVVIGPGIFRRINDRLELSIGGFIVVSHATHLKAYEFDFEHSNAKETRIDKVVLMAGLDSYLSVFIIPDVFSIGGGVFVTSVELNPTNAPMTFLRFSKMDLTSETDPDKNTSIDADAYTNATQVGFLGTAAFTIANRIQLYAKYNYFPMHAFKNGEGISQVGPVHLSCLQFGMSLRFLAPHTASRF